MNELLDILCYCNLILRIVNEDLNSDRCCRLQNKLLEIEIIIVF